MNHYNYYIVIQGEDIHELIRKVNEAIAIGFEPMGQFSVVKKWWRREFLSNFFATKEWWHKSLRFYQPVYKRRFEDYLRLAETHNIQFPSMDHAWRAYRDNSHPELKKYKKLEYKKWKETLRY